MNPCTPTRSVDRRLTALAAALAVGIALPATAADRNPGALVIPDLTTGAQAPKKSRHDWNLGAAGARGWIFSDKMVTTDARQIGVTLVERGSPADGALAVGDVLLGAGGRPFSSDPRTELGRALTRAESEEGGGRLVLTRWRAGVSEDVVLQLPVLGSYSATAPYDCPKSRRVLTAGLQALATRVADPEYAASHDPIPRALNALALLAGGDPVHRPLVEREARWAAGFTTDAFHTWYYGYVMLLLSEYALATGDPSVMPGLTRLATEAALGQSAVGSWGHGFAQPGGRLGGYGMMNSPGLVLTISLVLAREAGVKHPAVDQAIERSARLVRFYTGKGAVPYGDHHPWIETHEDNGKCGMAAVLFNQLGDLESASFFTRMSAASHGSERDGGHTGNFFNILWAMPGVALAGPHATGAWMNEFGTWYFDLARRWDGSFRHQGPPEPEPDSYDGWDATGAYLLACAMPLKTIRLTGKGPGVMPPLDTAAAQSLIRDGRGWTNKDRESAYDALSPDQLIERLGSWSPVVRERAASALARRSNPPVSEIVDLLNSPRIEFQYGACQAVIALRDRGTLALGRLRERLSSKDLWLRIKAAEALASLGPAARVAVPELLELLAPADPAFDPRGMLQRYGAFALFDREAGGLLSGSLDGVDRAALLQAVRAGLQNQDGRARSALGSVYRHLTAEEITPLLPAILQAVTDPAPSGEMFADGIRLEGLHLLARHRIEEGLRACVRYARDQNPWASEERTPEIMNILLTYGAHAQAVIPDLQQLITFFEQDTREFPAHLTRKKIQCVRDTIRAVESATEKPELRRLP
ncbi:MAG: DUF6288 domain-containing protein [Verrucomicrobiales bacterium]